MKKFIYGFVGLLFLSVAYMACNKIEAQDVEKEVLETRAARCNDIGYSGLLCAVEELQNEVAALKAQLASVNNVKERLTITGQNFISTPGWTAVNAKSGAEVKYDVAENSAVYWPKTAKGYTGFKYIFSNSAGTAALEIDPDTGTLTWNDKGVKHVLKVQ